MEYEELLEKAYKELKPIKEISERFEIPKVRTHLEGNKTIIVNFQHICSTLRRKPQHLAKFLMKELAASGKMNDKLILNRKLKFSLIDDKVEAYVKEFVICPECKKPDTELVKESRFLFLRCLACGAKHSVRSKI